MSHQNTPQQAAEDILGQFYFALGQGAGSMRIQRAAISALRERYVGSITRSFTHWEADAPNILSFIAQVGRLSALKATQAGRTFISSQDFTEARRVVEANVHGSGDRKHGLFAGIWCQIVPGENPEVPSGDEATPTAALPEPPRVFAKTSPMIH